MLYVDAANNAKLELDRNTANFALASFGQSAKCGISSFILIFTFGILVAIC